MKLEHVAMYVEDIESARSFFEKYFQAQSNDLYHNKKIGFRSYFLSFDDGSRLEIMTKPDLVSQNNTEAHTGLIHLAFSVGSKETVDTLTERLRTDGYRVVSEPRTTGDGYYESCVVGPEGNLVEITV